MEYTNAICRACGNPFYVKPMNSIKGEVECPSCGEKEKLILPPREMLDQEVRKMWGVPSKYPIVLSREEFIDQFNFLREKKSFIKKYPPMEFSCLRPTFDIMQMMVKIFLFQGFGPFFFGTNRVELIMLSSARIYLREFREWFDKLIIVKYQRNQRNKISAD